MTLPEGLKNIYQAIRNIATPIKGTMEFYQEFNDVLQAIYFEKKIKGWTRAKKMALINGDGFEFYLNAEMLQTVKITIADHKGFDSAIRLAFVNL